MNDFSILHAHIGGDGPDEQDPLPYDEDASLHDNVVATIPSAISNQSIIGTQVPDGRVKFLNG